MVTWSGLTPFSGQLEAWLRSKPAAGPPLSVVNTIIESWHLLFFWMMWLIVMMIFMNSYMMSQIILRPGACGCAGALQRLCQHSRRACKASRRTYAGSSPTRTDMYFAACPLLFCEMNRCFSLPTLISVSGILPWCSCVVGLHLQGPVQCANVDITASVQCLIPSLAFNFSNGKCKTKLNNFH